MPIHDRYHRQRLLSPIGDAGQEQLASSRVLIIGVGALGTVSADALCRAGVGTLRLVDRDVVEETNLQRQSLYEERDVGYPKAEAARDRLARVNRDVQIEARSAHADASNILDLMKDVDIVLDGTDNFETRYLINDACVKISTPYVYAGAVGTSGTGAVIVPGETGCLRCLLPEAPSPEHTESCDTSGVLAPLVWMVACWQAIEAIKLLTDQHEAISRGVRSFDALSPATTSRALPDALERSTSCPCCVERRFSYLEGQALSGAVTLCGRGAVQVTPGREVVWNAASLAERLALFGDVEHAGSSVRVEIDGYGLTVFTDGRAIIHGADDEAHARALYDRYVGM